MSVFSHKQLHSAGISLLLGLLALVHPLPATAEHSDTLIDERDIFEQTRVVMLLLDPENGGIVDANQAAADFYGYSLTELPQLSIADLNIDSPARIRENIQQIETRSRNYFHFQHQLADGSIRDVEVYSWPVVANGKSFLFSIVHDVTERERAREQLEEATARLRRAEEAASFGHWVFNLNTGMVDASPGTQRIYGLSDPPWPIPRTQEVPLPEERSRLDREIQQLIEKGEEYNIRFRIERPNDGEIRYIHSMAEYNQETNSVFGIIRDYTEEALAEQKAQQRTRMLILTIALAAVIQLGIILILVRAVLRLRRAEARIKNMVTEKDTLLREVHHRIKNNMGTIINLLSLQAESIDNSEAQNALEESRNRVQSMMVIYEKLYRSTNYGEIPIREYLETLAHEITATFPQRIRIEIITELEDFPVEAQKMFHLGILVNELLTNAMKYAFPDGRHGTVRITAQRSGRIACIGIEDNGVGISPAAVNADGSAKSPGFGLVLVEILGQQLNARIEREDKDTGAGGGTTFRVYFDPGTPAADDSN